MKIPIFPGKYHQNGGFSRKAMLVYRSFLPASRSGTCEILKMCRFFLEKLGPGLIFLNFHPYLGKISNLTNIFHMGWNHQLVDHCHLSWSEGIFIYDDTMMVTMMLI